jgi:hypothetical protein
MVDASLVDGYRVLKRLRYGGLYRYDRIGEVDEGREEKNQGDSYFLLSFGTVSGRIASL